MNNKRDSSLFEEPPTSNKKVRLDTCDDILSQVLNNNSIQIEGTVILKNNKKYHLPFFQSCPLTHSQYFAKQAQITSLEVFANKSYC